MTRKEERTESAVKKGYEAFANSFNCCQSTLAGLMREFLPDDPCMEGILACAVPLPGGAVRGETCGAYSGALMFFGRLYHQDNTTTPFKVDPRRLKVRGYGPATEFGDRFVEKLGGSRCIEIHPTIVGKAYDLSNSKEMMQFYMGGAKDGCQKVVETGSRLVCDLIMDDDGNIIGR